MDKRVFFLELICTKCNTNNKIQIYDSSAEKSCAECGRVVFRPANANGTRVEAKKNPVKEMLLLAKTLMGKTEFCQRQSAKFNGKPFEGWTMPNSVVDSMSCDGAIEKAARQLYIDGFDPKFKTLSEYMVLRTVAKKAVVLFANFDGDLWKLNDQEGMTKEKMLELLDGAINMCKSD